MRDADATIAALTADPARTALFADYDGSLAPIVERPEDAVPLPEALDVLGQLAAVLGRVGVVSGRPVEFLAAQLPVAGLTFTGLYGMEHSIDGTRTVDARVVPYLDAVAAATTELEAVLPASAVERKAGVSVTVHWRPIPERADEIARLADDIAARHGLAVLRTRMAVELRPPVAIDKGTAVASLVAGFATAAFAGDDTGDLPAFAALGLAIDAGTLQHAVRIGVHSPEAPPDLATAVDVLVDGPEGLVAFLRRVRDEIV